MTFRSSTNFGFPGYGPKELCQKPKVGLARGFNAFSQSTPGDSGFLRQSILSSQSPAASRIFFYASSQNDGQERLFLFTLLLPKCNMAVIHVVHALRADFRAHRTFVRQRRMNVIEEYGIRMS